MNRQMKQILSRNKKALVESKKDFRAIFEITFSCGDNIICEDSDGAHTYKEVYDKICSASIGLRQKIGSSGQLVALETENSLEWLVAFWAILMSGNKPYLVNLKYPYSLSNSILKRLGITHSVCAENSKLDAKSIAIDSLYCDNTICDLSHFADEIAFSSSATSMNESVCFYSGLQVAEQILNFESIVKECPDIVGHYNGHLKLLAFLPFYHVFGLFAVCFWFTFFGRTLVFLSDYSADTILSTCREHKVTHIFAVPLLWHSVEKEVMSVISGQSEKKQRQFYGALKSMTKLQNLCPKLGRFIAKRVLSEVTGKTFGRSVLFCINGGSYLRSSTMEFFNAIGYNLHNGYGMSEIGITSVELRKKPKQLNLSSIGRPFDSVEYSLRNGVLWVKGSSLCTKKLINGETITMSDWFNTEDNVTEIDGYYFIHGRQSDLVIGESGESINPDTIEQQFNLEGATALSVLGLKGVSGDELSMIIQIDRNIDSRSLDSMIEKIGHINNGLSNTYEVKNVHFTYDEIAPPNAVKISRRRLIKMIENSEINLISLCDIKNA